MTNLTFSGIILFFSWLTPWTHGIITPREAHPPALAAACDLTVDAGQDKELCAPGGIIGLSGTVSANSLYYQWTPSDGLNNPQTLNPVAVITGPITYTLTSYAIDPVNPNLIVNGNFNDGNMGFYTDYFYVSDIPNQADELILPGAYTVIHNPKLVHDNFHPCGDHTTGNGNMMVLNGAANLQNVWCQDVPVQPNNYYNISAWVTSVHPSSPAILKFEVNGSPIGPTINAFPLPCLWSPFNAIWNSGANTTATICILNLNTAGGGNDFAIDDISMTALCSVSDEVSITIVSEDVPEPMPAGPMVVCSGETSTYTSSFPPGTDIWIYEWTVSPGSTILSGQGSSQIDVQWNGAGQKEVCLRVETQCHESEGCLDVTIAGVPESPFITSPSSLCPGDQATLYGAEENSTDVYNWTVPSQINIISGQGTNELEIEWGSAGEAEICLEVTNDCGSTDNCITLMLHDISMTQFDTVICEGTTFHFNNTTYGNGNLTGVETFTNIHGCDSLVQVNVTESSSLEFMVTKNICEGDVVFLEGGFQTQPGIYVDSFMTISDCDSIVFTELIVSPLDTTWIFSQTCDPFQAGTITIIHDQFCDSTVITEVQFIPADTTYYYLSSCLPADTGTTVVTLSNFYGCDSLIITKTILLESDHTFIFDKTCDPSVADTSIQSFTNVHGCDSLVTHYITFITSDYTFLTSSSCSPQDTGTFVTQLLNTAGCDSIVESVVSLFPADICEFETVYSLEQPLCYGEAAILHFDFQTGLAPFHLLLINNGIETNFDYSTSGQYSIPLNMSGSTQFIFSSANGLSLSFTENITGPPPLQIEIESSTDYNGFDVACYGDTTGSIVTNIISGGTGLLTYEWSNGKASSGLNNIPAGFYAVTVTDNNGCEAYAEFNVTQPESIEFNIETTDVSCPEENDGKIIISNIHGGASPWMVSLDGNAFQSSFDFENLSGGAYQVVVRDKNGCTVEEQVMLNEPATWHISLGNDTSIVFGDDILLVPNIIGSPAGNVQLSWLDLDCDPCSTRLVEPPVTTSYYITAVDENGCIFEDHIRVEVRINMDVYIPNVFSPNNDGANDLFIISTGDGVEEISELSIFDRWGNQVFEKFNFQPGDASVSWDGRTHGKDLASGVYAYKVILKFKDGHTQHRIGDITLIR